MGTGAVCPAKTLQEGIGKSAGEWHFTLGERLTCPDGRDHITQHMLMLSTYLGHSHAALTYWYLEAVPELMRSIAQCCEAHVAGGKP